MITIHQRYRRTDGQTDRQTDRRHFCKTALCTKVHSTVTKGSRVLDTVIAFWSLMWLVDDLDRADRHSSFCLASLLCCAIMTAQLVWASDICCCRPNCLELTERWSAWSDT